MRPLDTIEAALTDLRLGKMIIVVDDEDRENEGDFVMPAEAVTPEAVNFMATYGRGMICAPLKGSLAKKLNLPLQTSTGTAPLGTAFTVTIDACNGVSTGISASDRAHTLKLLTSALVTEHDFVRPGHIFPLIAREGGVLERAGHTEAAVDLARMAGFSPVGTICEIMNEDGTMARRDELDVVAQKHNLKMISIADLVLWRKKNESLITEVEVTTLPTKSGEFSLHIFRSEILKEEAIAIVKGDLSDFKTENLLVRVHSECFTGDVLGSLRCDCGEQLQLSLEMIEDEGRGIVVYLKQEGRGIGLFNKVKAYQLQDQGLDTVDANLRLGFPADGRDYTMAAQILRHYGVTSMELMTNNPLKVRALQQLTEMEITRRPLSVEPRAQNAKYLLTKQTKFGHWPTDVHH